MSAAKALLIFCFLGRCTGESGIHLFGGTYVRTDFQLPPLQQLTICTWVKITPIQPGRSNDQQYILSYYERGQKELLSLSLRPPGLVNNQQGEVIASLNGNAYEAMISGKDFKYYYDRWKSFCVSWDLSRLEIKIFADGVFLPQRKGAIMQSQQAYIRGGSPLVIGQLYSNAPVNARTAFEGIVGSMKIWRTVSDSQSIKGRIECTSLATVYNMGASYVRPFSSGGSRTTLREIDNTCSLIACQNPETAIFLPQTNSFSRPIITLFKIPREGVVIQYKCKSGHRLYPFLSNSRTCVRRTDQRLEWSGSTPYCSDGASLPRIGVTLTAAGNTNLTAASANGKEGESSPIAPILVPILVILLLIGLIIAGVVLHKRGKLKHMWEKCPFKKKVPQAPDHNEGTSSHDNPVYDGNLYESITKPLKPIGSQPPASCTDHTSVKIENVVPAAIDQEKSGPTLPRRITKLSAQRASGGNINFGRSDKYRAEKKGVAEDHPSHYLNREALYEMGKTHHGVSNL